MQKTSDFKRLSNHILSLSVNKTDFNEAKKEWELDIIVVTENFGSCPCGQAIKEHCQLKNKLNQKTTYVGNVCVHRFIEINTKPIFNGFKRVQKRNVATPNAELIQYAWERGYLYSRKEYDFLESIKGKRKLSEGQEGWLTKINRRIVETIVVNRLPR